MRAIISYQIATYSGTVEVSCSDDDDNEALISRARRQLRQRAGSLPFGYQSFLVVSRNA